MYFQKFTYRVSLMPPFDGQLVNSTSEVSINFVFNHTDDPGDECGMENHQSVTRNR